MIASILISLLVGLVAGIVLGAKAKAQVRYDQGFADGEREGLRYCAGPICIQCGGPDDEYMAHLNTEEAQI